LFAGTEKGLYLSWNGGQQWEPFQLNLPTAPITDLKFFRGDLIVATSGRSFWILDDLSPLAAYTPQQAGLKLYAPDPAYNGSWSSPLSETNEDIKGTDAFEGVNPANGVALYYELPDLADSVAVRLEVRDSSGKLIRSFTSKKDSTYLKYDGGPPNAPQLPKKKGLNRFVWDMQYPIMPGIPNAYMEVNYEGHRVSPGTYSFRLTAGTLQAETKGTILEVPGFETAAGQYAEYDAFMTDMEHTLTGMHNMVNSLYKVQQQLSELLPTLSSDALKEEGEALLEVMKAWDSDMIQRKSKAYDDVENYPNKFTANYMFLIGQCNSAIPRINQPGRERKAELDSQWKALEARGNALISQQIPAFNQKLWAAGIGALRITE
jgi:uncharacterized protein YwgA